ncbi:MAG: hypothetical protein ACQES9_05080 [Myxococcota bacterium]
MTEENSATQIECAECGKKIAPNKGYSYDERVYCKDCYFKDSKFGPLGDQYKECPECGNKVHVFTIKCANCGTQIHKTGTIRAKRPVKTSVILAYGILALIIIVSAFTVPGFSNKGILAWISAVSGMLIALHGLMGVMFFFLPFGFKTIYKFSAFGGGLLETIIGLYLLVWPKL